MIQVCHFIPGRLRVKVSRINHNQVLADDLAGWLKQSALIKSVEARPKSGSVIICFHPQTTGRKELLNLLQDWPAFLEKRAADKALPVASACGMKCRPCRPGEKPVSFVRRIVGVAVLSCYVIYVIVKKVFFKSPFSESTFSLTSAVAIVGAWPLFKQAWIDFTAGCHKSLLPFLAATCVLAIILGEAMTALEVIWILRVGMLLEDYVARRSHAAIREILQLAAKNTFILVNGVEVEIPADQVSLGDTVVCHTGEKIPVDGSVIKGAAMVDESSITGRAEAEERREDDKVFAGTIVQQGVIFINAEKVGDDTYLCRILHMVEDSLDNRAPAEGRADVLAARLMRLGVFAVGGTFLLTFDPMRAFTVMLVLACPCATVLAASTAVSAALANAAKNYILIKGGLYLEQIGEADSFCFDKTGTLTSDVPHLVEIIPRTYNQEPDNILSLAASAEAHNQHPMARALLSAAEERGIEPEAHAVCDFILGRGVRATVGNDQVLVGNERLMNEENVNIQYFKNRTVEQINRGHTVIYVVKNNKVQGVIVVANIIRPKTKDVLDWLRKDGVNELHLVTGDTEPVGRAMAEALDFHHYQADLLPEGKAEYLERLEKSGKQTVMIGDGINDALALAKASIGVAMGAGGAEVAIEAADIALVDSDLERLVRLRQLSRQTLAVIEQNYLLAMTTNVGGVFLGALGMLSPIMAGGLHVVHTLGILANSSRLLNWKAPGLEKE